MSNWSGLYTVGQLSEPSRMPSLSLSIAIVVVEVVGSTVVVVEVVGSTVVVVGTTVVVVGAIVVVVGTMIVVVVSLHSK